MAKFLEPYPDTIEVVESVIARADLNRYMEFKILTDNKQKKVVNAVKANDLVKHMTRNDIVIVINEYVFDKLNPEQQILIVEEELGGIHYDTEKEKIVITKKDVETWSGIISKYGIDKYMKTKELIKLVYQQEKDGEEGNPEVIQSTEESND